MIIGTQQLIEQLGLLIGAIATGQPDQIEKEISASKDLIALDATNHRAPRDDKSQRYYVSFSACVSASSPYSAAKTMVSLMVERGYGPTLIVCNPEDVSTVAVDLALPEDNGGVSRVITPTLVQAGPNVFVSAGVEPFGCGKPCDFYLGVGDCDLHVTRGSNTTTVAAFPMSDETAAGRKPLNQFSINNYTVQ